MNRRILRAVCLTCEWKYDNSIPLEHSRKIRSALANRDIVVQTHVDVTGHTRLNFVDVTVTTRILTRSNQMTLAEDPDIDLKGLLG